MVKVDGKRKSETVAEYLSKGAKWCADQLWNARKENDTIRKDMDRLRKELAQSEITNMTAGAYKEANHLMNEVLVGHNIFPVRLTLYFRENDCSGCAEGEGSYSCFECIPPEKEIIETVSMYTMRIEDGYLEGITSDFKSRGVECFKITNTDTGEILYEERKKE